LAVEKNGERLALLDAEKNTVAIYKKDGGTFVEQLRIEAETKTKDVEFDETGGLWVLSGGVVGKVK